MTRDTKITSDLNPEVTSDKGVMVTVAIFDNHDQQKKSKIVFDCGKQELSNILDKLSSNGKNWEPNNQQ